MNGAISQTLKTSSWTVNIEHWVRNYPYLYHCDWGGLLEFQGQGGFFKLEIEVHGGTYDWNSMNLHEGGSRGDRHARVWFDKYIQMNWTHSWLQQKACYKTSINRSRRCVHSYMYTEKSNNIWAVHVHMHWAPQTNEFLVRKPFAMNSPTQSMFVYLVPVIHNFIHKETALITSEQVNIN